MKFDTSYRKNWSNPPWYSSYEQNNYGEIFYSIIRVYQPAVVVELGTKAGFSAYHIARGLKENVKGKLDCYDLWEKYEFSTVPISVAEKNLREFKNIVSLNLEDAKLVHKKYESVDILHVDLSNEGGILEEIIPYWIDKVRQLIIVEGGSEEHDNLPWMKNFKKKPMKKWLQMFSKKYSDIEYLTLEPFPSLTILKKK